jgi:uncharacterized protein YeaC (DUF1315 family)
MYNLEPQKKIIADIIELSEMDDDINMMDIVIDYAERHNIEIEHIAAIISKNALIFSKLQEVAEDLNFIPRESRLE